MSKEQIKILLVGNPNCGKSTIFNSISGADAHIGNYSGVTVEKKAATFNFNGQEITIEDLPGLYSLSPSSKEESLVRDTLGAGEFDLIANVVDSSNLERNLFLTIQLTEMRLPMVLILNMADELEKKGETIDKNLLEKILGIPVIQCIGYKTDSAQILKNFLLENSRKQIEPNFLWRNFKNQAPYSDISNLSHLLKENLPEDAKTWSRWLTIQAIEGDKVLLKKLAEQSPEILREVEKTAEKIRKEFEEEPASLIAAARYKIAQVISAKTIKKAENFAERDKKVSQNLPDKILLNRFLGLPIFFAMMYLCFQFVFALGEPMMNFIESAFIKLAQFIDNSWAGSSDMKSLVIDGIIGGVGGVLVFLPNIVLLFAALAVLEDSGYMARAAFLCDKLMRRFGLSGTSLIPMLVGFGCSVSGIMATRPLKNKVERIITIAVLPLFSCGARFSVFMLLIPAFFPKEYRAIALFGVYFIGIILALIFAKVLRLSVFKGEDSAFILELPPYRFPRLKTMFFQIFERAWDFLRKAGTLILGASIVLWAISNYPQKTVFSQDFDAQISAISANENLEDSARQSQIQELNNKKVAEKFDYTISGRISGALEPVLSPLGFDKRISSALVGALAAKEVFISQLGIAYNIENGGDGDASLREKLSKDYTFLQGISIILFLLIAMPCLATILTTYAETKSLKIAIAQAFGLTLLAYIICFAVYQIGLLF